MIVVAVESVALVSDIATKIEVLKHAAVVLDGVFPEVGADDPDRLRQAVVAARAALLQLRVTTAAVERDLGALDGYAAVLHIFEAERGS
jgi:hypothetical protein